MTGQDDLEMKTGEYQVNNWIDINDELPDSDYEVLACNERCIYIGQYSRHDRKWWDDSAVATELDSVSHWMHLPALPEVSIELPEELKTAESTLALGRSINNRFRDCDDGLGPIKGE